MQIEKIKIEKSSGKIQQPFFIAEVGVNYYDIALKQDISIIEAAKLMIDEAVKAGVDAVKFQSYKANTLASKNSPAYWDTTKEPTKNQFQLFQKFDKLEYADYIELMSYTQKKGSIFLTTLFDIESIEVLGDHLPAFKIASADLTNYPLIKKLAEYKKPMMFSIGASKLSEVFDTIHYVKELGIKEEQIGLFHCVLQYPTSPENANLSKIQAMQNIFPNDIIIGYSDHVPGIHNMLALTLSTIYGARIVEKHFTLDKELQGNDHYHAMDPTDIIQFRKNIDYLMQCTQSDTVDYVQVESKSRLHARRSIVANRDIDPKENLTEENLICKRPGSGISPIYWDMLLQNKAKAKKSIKEDQIITWEDITF